MTLTLALLAYGDCREPVMTTYDGRWFAFALCHFGCCRIWREFADVDERIKIGLHPVGLLLIEVDPAPAPDAPSGHADPRHHD